MSGEALLKQQRSGDLRGFGGKKKRLGQVKKQIQSFMEKA